MVTRTLRSLVMCAGFAACLTSLAKAQNVRLSDSAGRTATIARGDARFEVPNGGRPIPEGTVTIYSNFGSGDSYNCCGGWSESGQDSGFGKLIQAMAFSPAKATYALTQIDLAIGHSSGTNGYELDLDSDNNGRPGPTMKRWLIKNLPPLGSCCVVETIKVPHTQLHHVTLQKGRRYWLVPIVNADEDALWNANTTSVAGKGAVSSDGGATWNVIEFNPNGAFDVMGVAIR